MSKRQKLIESMRNNPTNVPFEDIDSVLKYYGFSRRQAGTGSSHYFYTHPAASLPVNIPRHRPIKAIYIQKALDMIDEVREAIENE